MLSGFSFEGAVNGALNADADGTISGNVVSVEVPPATDTSALIASFSVSAGASVSVGGTTQTGGSTANDFANQVTYVVTAEDGSTASYTVAVGSVEWVQEAYLIAFNGGGTDHFGRAVAASGDTIVVGARKEDSSQTTITNGGGASFDDGIQDAGAAYVFVRDGSAWTQQAYLKAANAGVDDGFGNSVSISDDTIVVGAFGEDSSQTTITNGAATGSDDGAQDAGAAYVFVRNGSTWTQQAYLKAANAGFDDRFNLLDCFLERYDCRWRADGRL